jgi:hypothetical protein
MRRILLAAGIVGVSLVLLAATSFAARAAQTVGPQRTPYAGPNAAAPGTGGYANPALGGRCSGILRGVCAMGWGMIGHSGTGMDSTSGRGHGCGAAGYMNNPSAGRTGWGTTSTRPVSSGQSGPYGKDVFAAADHPAGACINCHAKDDIHRGRFGTECSQCHTPGTWNRRS